MSLMILLRMNLGESLLTLMYADTVTLIVQLKKHKPLSLSLSQILSSMLFIGEVYESIISKEKCHVCKESLPPPSEWYWPGVQDFETLRLPFT